eukprot:gb/GEZJ01005527.1/.p1 GENE.gb/GEZJ01005527.1/~~gb/GEZJ01005527.1/.p1  ORF type:complete len:219 (+),score=23.64 gb/GEZJ01005527.1/:1067-1723(+)
MVLKIKERTDASVKIEYASQLCHLTKKIVETFLVRSAVKNFWIVTEFIKKSLQRDRKSNVEASKRESKKRTWNKIASSLAGYQRQQQPSKNERRVSSKTGALLHENNRDELTITPSYRRGQLHAQKNSEEGIDWRKMVKEAPPRNQETNINRSDAVHVIRQPRTESWYQTLLREMVSCNTIVPVREDQFEARKIRRNSHTPTMRRSNRILVRTRKRSL